MTNIHFHKVAAVTLGSLLTFSSSAFANTSNVEAINHQTSLSNSEILVAQTTTSKPITITTPQITITTPKPITIPTTVKPTPKPTTLKNNQAFSSAVGVAQTTLGKLLAAANSPAISGTGKAALAGAISKTISLIGNGVATSNSTSKIDLNATVKSLTQAQAALSEALAIANSTALSGPAKTTIAQSLVSAKTSLGNANAVAISLAK